MTVRPVVVAVDGSPESVRAAELAWRLARVHEKPCRPVLAVAPIIRELGMESAGPRSEALELVRDAARRDVAATLCEVLPAPVLDALEVRFGRSERVIAQAAAERRAGLVVIGGKHHGRLARGLGLSTAHHLVRMLEVPTLVVGAASGPVNRILVAVDLSAASEAAVLAARELAQRLDAQLRVLHVLEPLSHPSLGPITIDERLVRRQAAAHLERLASRLAGVAPADHVMREGDPADVIAAEVADWEADLLVVGSHGKGWIDRVLLGSTTERLLTRLPCSLLVIPVSERRTARGSSRAALRGRRRSAARARRA